MLKYASMVRRNAITAARPAGQPIALIHLGDLPPLRLPLPRRPYLPMTAPAQMRVAQIYPAVLETALEENLVVECAQRDFDVRDTPLGNNSERSIQLKGLKSCLYGVVLGKAAVIACVSRARTGGKLNKVL